MKRCPKCSFLYLDSDQLCDLDQTPLLTEDFGTDVGVTGYSEQKAERPSLTAGVSRPKRKLNPKALLAAIVGSLIIGLTLLLLTYQRMRPALQTSQPPPISQSQASQASRVSQVAQQASNQVVAKAELAQSESGSPDAQADNTSPSVEPSTTAKATPNTRPDSARVRVSSNPVSTGDITKSARGPVTIQLANGSTLEADEVWRTKAGIWYRRKGIVTFIKPDRVRALNH